VVCDRISVAGCVCFLNEFIKAHWKGIAAGLALYSVYWFYEILNGLIQHVSGNALWTVPTGTAFLILIGVGIELSFMFAIAGLGMRLTFLSLSSFS